MDVRSGCKQTGKPGRQAGREADRQARCSRYRARLPRQVATAVRLRLALALPVCVEFCVLTIARGAPSLSSRSPSARCHHHRSPLLTARSHTCLAHLLSQTLETLETPPKLPRRWSPWPSPHHPLHALARSPDDRSFALTIARPSSIPFPIRVTTRRHQNRDAAHGSQAAAAPVPAPPAAADSRSRCSARDR